MRTAAPHRRATGTVVRGALSARPQLLPACAEALVALAQPSDDAGGDAAGAGAVLEDAALAALEVLRPTLAALVSRPPPELCRAWARCGEAQSGVEEALRSDGALGWAHCGSI